MREETWIRILTITDRLLKKAAHAVSTALAVHSSPPTQSRSPARAALEQSGGSSPGADCTPVSVPDAVAELSRPTGNTGLDHVHEMTIDCLQRGYLYAVRDPHNELRFLVTPAGKAYIKRILDDNS